MAEYTANIYLGDKTAFIGDSIRITGELNTDELCLVAIISEGLRALRNKYPLAYEPTLKALQDKDKIAKCEWVEMDKNNQRLKVHTCDADKKYRHAETVKEARGRYKVFTCPLEVAIVLRNRRRLTLTQPIPEKDSD